MENQVKVTCEDVTQNLPTTHEDLAKQLRIENNKLKKELADREKEIVNLKEQVENTVRDNKLLAHFVDLCKTEVNFIYNTLERK